MSEMEDLASDLGPGSVPSEGRRLAKDRLERALSSFELPGEVLVRLSRSKKLVLLGVALLTVGLTGRAAADTTPDVKKQAAPIASASAKVTKPQTTRPQPTKPQPTKPQPIKPAPPKKTTKKVAGRTPSGPGGSKMITGSKAVALTFDDGPDPAQTPQILKLLAQNKVHATFCLVGRNVEKNPEIVRQIVAAGHTLCNHTWSHNLKLGKQPAAKIKADLARTSAAIHKAAPNAKIAYFRAPGGNFTPGVVAIAKSMGMTSLYWRVDPRDWDHPEGETHTQHKARVISRVEQHTHNGAIVLSHDYAQPDTIVAYRTLLPWLKKRYQLVGLPT
jgi:peptidoglycan/xylan/chitin deacetylase (PgdA/CDA1 family)